MITSNGCVKFNAEAGNTYIIRKKRGRYERLLLGCF